MAQLVYTEEEIMSEHDYARPQIVAGRRAHGGFDAEGNYITPRTRIRPKAVGAWAEALRERGGEVFQVDAALQRRERYPSEEQQKLLIQEGLEQTFWNSLTIIGLLEARGRILADAEFPDLQEIICEDISEMGIGHLSRGMLKAHGLDEGGEPDKGIGAHDVMWFAVRDLALGPRDFPVPEPPQLIGRPARAQRLAPEIPEAHERLILFMMNLLMIEIGAENLFSGNERLLRDPELFTDRRGQAEHAAEIVNRIRQDEQLHVTSLCTNLGELQSITFKTLSGGTIRGAEIVDRLWKEVVHFFAVEGPKLQREQQRQALTQRILEVPKGDEILAEFESLEARNVGREGR